MRTVTLTIWPTRQIDVDDSEFASLLHDGLILTDPAAAPVAAPEPETAPAADPTPTVTERRRRRT